MDVKDWCSRPRLGFGGIARLIALLALTLAAFTAACAVDDAGDGPTPTSPTSTVADTATPEDPPTETSTTTPTAEPGRLYERGYRSGVAPVDELMEVLEMGDGELLATMVELLERPCTTEPTGILEDPPCEEGETAGTIVKVFVWSNCEPMYIRGPDAENALRTFGQYEYRLAYAYDNGAELRVVVGTGDDHGFREVLLTREGGVIGFTLMCGGRILGAERG